MVRLLCWSKSLHVLKQLVDIAVFTPRFLVRISVIKYVCLPAETVLVCNDPVYVTPFLSVGYNSQFSLMLLVDAT
jgi:hypothetical protein